MQRIAGVRLGHLAEDGLVGAAACIGQQPELAVQRDAEGKDLLAGLGLQLLSVGIEGDGGLVGEIFTSIVSSVRSVKRLEQIWTKGSSLHHALYR